MQFLTQFLRHPIRVGAIAASSRALANEMTAEIDWQHVRHVVEYGPGTGAFTGSILELLPAGGRYFGIEINPTFVELLRRRYPGVTFYHDSVAQVRNLCDRENCDRVDAILCGLPWAAFSDRDQDDYLEAMMSVLRPGGHFVTFAYCQGLLLPAGQRFRHRLRSHFATVTCSRTVWCNLPPAFVYRCQTGLSATANSSTTGHWC